MLPFTLKRSPDCFIKLGFIKLLFCINVKVKSGPLVLLMLYFECKAAKRRTLSLNECLMDIEIQTSQSVSKHLKKDERIIRCYMQYNCCLDPDPGSVRKRETNKCKSPFGEKKSDGV